ncbi:Gx transporter family protein [Sporolactobacillus inulinus]|jgi:heptaprenyl diphosphate synthase|uniref:Heptaprenyl diphosphate synthase n=1 Tax=Sporolactobacillus inulinus CASD TaxID=1069536 RepID=A0A0U1QSA8_9BACL|nr:Gx transporter family protein [Sporolactobacillus inulinus]KLI03700.1 heptaprenyl diphosphate synthase [Sporolactobacillus inulinus CASD]GEB77038.1 heptaprenyl diphosphate synthase subunit I [Sporolactobacillus inulinus]
MTKNQRNAYIALLAAQAVIISLFENAIPFPFGIAPGAKLGLANVITCMALYTLATKDTIKVVSLRLILATLLGGTLSTFMYSAAGIVLSFIGMWLVKKLGPDRISLIGVSATGAILHNIGQLIIASWIAQTWTVLLYLPVLSFVGILAGIAIGVMANYLLTHVEKLQYYQKVKETNEKVHGW